MMLAITLRLGIHAMLFMVAIGVFFLGLGIGLQYSPQLGTALWIAAGLQAVLNLVWILHRRPAPGR